MFFARLPEESCPHIYSIFIFYPNLITLLTKLEPGSKIHAYTHRFRPVTYTDTNPDTQTHPHIHKHRHTHTLTPMTPFRPWSNALMTHPPKTYSLKKASPDAFYLSIMRGCSLLPVVIQVHVISERAVDTRPTIDCDGRP